MHGRLLSMSRIVSVICVVRVKSVCRPEFPDTTPAMNGGYQPEAVTKPIE